MAEEKITILFATPKLERKANWLLRQFTTIKSFAIPKTTEEQWALFKERGLSKQYQLGTGRAFFPTEKAWTYFLEFCGVLHAAEPFNSKSTRNDVFQSFNRAYARMLTDAKLPETVEELAAYLPSEFVTSLSSRHQRVFSKLVGLELSEQSFFRVGHCWIGRFDAVSLDWFHDTEYGVSTIEALNRFYEKNSPVMAGECIAGTGGFVSRENTYQCELALSILSVMLNMTYDRVFGNLWQLRLVTRPEHGLSRHMGFSLVHSGPNSRREMNSNHRLVGQWFKIDGKLLRACHEYLALGFINWIIQQDPEDQTDLAARLVNALLCFRQAATQVTPEMQVSALWICVESFFTGSNERVLKAVLPGLLGVTIATLQPKYWPEEAKSVNELKKVFTNYYRHRSRTFHHGRRGHVTASDVQQFSIVVSNLIVGVAHFIRGGYKTAKEIQANAEAFLERSS